MLVVVGGHQEQRNGITVELIIDIDFEGRQNLGFWGYLFVQPFFRTEARHGVPRILRTLGPKV
jgi:hypothetical protein